MIAPPYGWVRGNPPAMVCTACESLKGEALHRAGCVTIALEFTAEAMAKALEVTRSAVACVDSDEWGHGDDGEKGSYVKWDIQQMIDAALALWRGLTGWERG